MGSKDESQIRKSKSNWLVYFFWYNIVEITDYCFDVRIKLGNKKKFEWRKSLNVIKDFDRLNLSKKLSAHQLFDLNFLFMINNIIWMSLRISKSLRINPMSKQWIRRLSFIWKMISFDLWEVNNWIRKDVIIISKISAIVYKL